MEAWVDEGMGVLRTWFSELWLWTWVWMKMDLEGRGRLRDIRL